MSETKFAIWDTLADFDAWLSAKNTEVGLPDGVGTTTYTSPNIHADGRVAAKIITPDDDASLTAGQLSGLLSEADAIQQGFLDVSE